MVKPLTFGAVLLVLAFLSSPPAMNSSSSGAQTALVHHPTGFQFPLDVGPFRRESEMRHYDSAGNDVSIGYNADPWSFDFIAMTVYVYPAPPVSERLTSEASLEKEFEGVKAQVMKHDHDPRFFYEQTVPFDGHHMAHQTKRAVFSTFCGLASVPCWSEAIFFRSHDWFVLYRETYPQFCGQRCSDRGKEFMLALRWPDSIVQAP